MEKFSAGYGEMVACIFPDKDRQRFLLSRWNNFVFFLSIPARRRSPVAFSVMISFQFLLLSPRFCFFLFSCLVPRETKLTRIFPDIWCDIYIYICARLCGKSFTKSGLEICVKKVRGKEMEIIKDKYLCVPLFYEKIGG